MNMIRDIPLVLQLDVSGNPAKFITYQDSAYYYAKDLVAWSMGELDFDIYGGMSRMTGEQSTMTMNTIIAIKGKVSDRQFAHNNRVPLSNQTLFRRDKNICAYCGNHHSSNRLTRDHIIPVSKNGRNVWENVVTSCSPCNKHKSNMILKDTNMELLFVPYAPNRSEYLLLRNKKVLADQMEFLMSRVPKHSRLFD